MFEPAIDTNDGDAGGCAEGGRQQFNGPDKDDLNVLIREDEEKRTRKIPPAPLAIGSMGEADEIIGGLSVPTKMPGFSWGISPRHCRRGSALHKQAGTICSGCYARAGRYGMKNTLAAMERRYAQSFNPRWVEAMVYRLEDESNMRWMDSGDLDERLLPMIVEVGRQTPNTRHWIATRERELVAQYLADHTLPANVCIRISGDFVDQTDDLPWVEGCTVSTVTRDVPVDGAHNCPATWSKDKSINSCDTACCRACWEVPHVNYRLHTQNQGSAFFTLSAADEASLDEYNAVPVPEINVADLMESVDPSDDSTRRVRVDDILTRFRDRLEQIQRRGGFAMQFEIGRTILFYSAWIIRVERDEERQTKALARMSDVYDEFKIPGTTAQLWKRVVARFDPDVKSGSTTMEMLAEVGIGKLDVLVGLADIDRSYWSLGADGAILLSSEITDGPFDVREITIKDLRERRATLLANKVLSETPIQKPLGGQKTHSPSGGVPNSNPPDLLTQQQTLTSPPKCPDTPPPTKPAGDQRTDTANAVTATMVNDIIADDSEQRWKTRIFNGRLVRSDSTVSTFEVAPTLPDLDAYAILEAPSLGDGSIPVRQLLWYDGPTGRTLNFPLS